MPPQSVGKVRQAQAATGARKPVRAAMTACGPARVLPSPDALSSACRMLTAPVTLSWAPQDKLWMAVKDYMLTVASYDEETMDALPSRIKSKI